MPLSIEEIQDLVEDAIHRGLLYRAEGTVLSTEDGANFAARAALGALLGNAGGPEFNTYCANQKKATGWLIARSEPMFSGRARSLLKLRRDPTVASMLTDVERELVRPLVDHHTKLGGRRPTDAEIASLTAMLLAKVLRDKDLGNRDLSRIVQVLVRESNGNVGLDVRPSTETPAEEHASSSGGLDSADAKTAILGFSEALLRAASWSLSQVCERSSLADEPDLKLTINGLGTGIWLFHNLYFFHALMAVAVDQGNDALYKVFIELLDKDIQGHSLRLGHDYPESMVEQMADMTKQDFAAFADYGPLDAGESATADPSPTPLTEAFASRLAQYIITEIEENPGEIALERFRAAIMQETPVIIHEALRERLAITYFVEVLRLYTR